MDDHHKPRISGLHHLKIAVSNLQDSLDWYAKVFGAIRRPEYDHVDGGGNLFAVLVAIPGLDTMIEFRLAPRIAAGLRGFDPIVFSTELRDDLVRWQSHLDALGIENSGLIYGIVGWTLIWRDPDGLSVRLYSEEEHELDLEHADIGNPWLRYPDA
jgi:catechol 2,3-dioxygenase-like lactoylglutathione lyase family enzyme